MARPIDATFPPSRRFEPAPVMVERSSTPEIKPLYENLIQEVATGDGYSVQLGHAKIMRCDDRGVTEPEAQLQTLRDSLIQMTEEPITIDGQGYDLRGSRIAQEIIRRMKGSV